MGSIYPVTEHLANRVKYKRSNEETAAIVGVVEPEPDDTILTVCGSGDMPFAFAAAGANVIAFDASQEQIRWAQARLGALLAGDVDAFLMPFPHDDVPPREYFSQDMIDALQANPTRIDMVHAPLEDVAGGDFSAVPTKLYLSNVLTYRRLDPAWGARHLDAITGAHPTITRLVSLRRMRDEVPVLAGWKRDGAASESATMWHTLQYNSFYPCKWQVDVYNR